MEDIIGSFSGVYQLQFVRRYHLEFIGNYYTGINCNFYSGYYLEMSAKISLGYQLKNFKWLSVKNLFEVIGENFIGLSVEIY